MSNRLRNPNRLKASSAVLAVAVGAFACSGCRATERKYGPPDSEITCINVFDGANFRTGPYVGDVQSGDQNLLFTLAVKNGTNSIEVTTPNGVHTYNEDANGLWYGIDSKDIINASTDLAFIANEDRDGIVWVNHQLSSKCATNTSRS